MKCVKAGMEEGIMPIKSFCARWGDENIIYKQNILFGAVHSYNEKKKFLIVNSMKSKSQDRRGESVKKKKRGKKKKARASTVKRCLSNSKR